MQHQRLEEAIFKRRASHGRETTAPLGGYGVRDVTTSIPQRDEGHPGDGPPLPSGSSAQPRAAAHVSESPHPQRLLHSPLGQAGDTPNQLRTTPSSAWKGLTHMTRQRSRALNHFYLTGRHTPLSSLCAPAALKPHAKNPLAFLEPKAPQTLHKVLLLGNIHRYPGVPPLSGSSPGQKSSPGRGQKHFTPTPRCELDAVPTCDSPGMLRSWGAGPKASFLILTSSRQLSARPARSGEAALGGVCPAPAQGTELVVPPQVGSFQGGFPGIQPPAKPADERAEDGGAEDDEDPGVHDGVHGEKPQGAEVSVLVEIGGKGPHVRPDLSKKNEEIGKIEGRCPYRGKAESKKIPLRAAKEVLTPRYPYASNQHVLWVADPETGTWGWILAQGDHVPIRARSLELKIRSQGLGLCHGVNGAKTQPHLCCPPTPLRWVSDQASIG